MIVYKNYSIDVCKYLHNYKDFLCINCCIGNDKKSLDEFQALKKFADDKEYKKVWEIIIKNRTYSRGTLIGQSQVEHGNCPFTNDFFSVPLLKMRPPVLGDLWHPATLFFINKQPVCARCWRFRNGYNKTA